MFSKNKHPPIRSLIAHGCHVRGDLSFADGLGIDGTVEGLVHGKVDAALQQGKKNSQGTLVFISEHGCVVGGIHADTVIINGQVQGPVHAERVLELQPKARVSGDVTYRQLEMHQGALISGRMLPLVPTAVSGGAQEATPAGAKGHPSQSPDSLPDEHRSSPGKSK